MNINLKLSIFISTSEMEKPEEVVDVEKIVQQGKAILKGEITSTSTKSTLESIGSEVEQVRYAGEGKLSEAGQAVLKDLEEILVSGAEVTGAIPPETFLHAARAQQKAVQAGEEIGQKATEQGEEVENVAMNLASLLRMLFTCSEFRDAVSDWSKWLKDVMIVQVEKTQKAVEETVEEVKVEVELGKGEKQEEKQEEKQHEQEIGQVPIDDPKTFKVPPVSDEQLDKLIGMLEWMQERQEYQTAIGYIFNQFSDLSSILGIQEKEEEKEKELAPEVPAVEAVVDEVKLVGLDTLKAVENWTHRSTDPFKSHLKSVSDHLKLDNRLRSTLQSLAHFLTNCFNEPGFLNDRKWIREEARDRLYDVRSSMESEGFKVDLQGLADEARDLINALDREPRTTHLKESFRKLLQDLFVAEQEPSQGLFAGSGFRLKTELLNDVGLIVGDLLQRAKYIRVPDIEVHDEDLDFTARNVILDAAELIPQQFKMTIVTENLVEKMKNEHQKQSEREGIITDEEKERVFVNLESPQSSTTKPAMTLSTTSDWKTHLKFKVKGIHGHCRNVHFNVRKRTGFPQLSDEGLADLRVWGPKGMLIKLVLRPEWVTEEIFEKELKTTEKVIGNGTVENCMY